jgi:hypothetical protein
MVGAQNSTVKSVPQLFPLISTGTEVEVPETDAVTVTGLASAPPAETMKARKLTIANAKTNLYLVISISPNFGCEAIGCAQMPPAPTLKFLLLLF